MKHIRQTGFTFIELSIVLVIIGIVAMLVAFLFPSFRNLGMAAGAMQNLQEQREALLGFAYTHGRLPYADTNNDGVEDAGATIGHFPYLSLGLAAPLRNAEGLDYMYSVYVNPDGLYPPQTDADLGVDKDRFFPIMADGLQKSANPPDPAYVIGGNNQTWTDSSVVLTGSRPSTGARQLFNINQLDYCRALDVAEQQPSVVTSSLYIDSGAKQNVAYVLVDPGAADMNTDGSPFDGLNGSGVGFDAPTRGASLTYDDRVEAGYFTDLWERMGCAGLLSASGHAHPNIESTTAMFRQSLQDYKYQTRLLLDMAAADYIQQTASLLSAIAGLASATADLFSGMSAAIVKPPEAESPVFAGVAIALNAIATVEASILEQKAVDNYNSVAQQLIDLETLINQLETLHNSIKVDVIASDRDAFSHQ